MTPEQREAEGGGMSAMNERRVRGLREGVQ